MKVTASVIIGAALSLLSLVTAAPQQNCPDWLKQSGIANDMGLLSDTVSWDTGDCDGVCGHYKTLYTANGKYQTRMRIYQSEATQSIFIIFRPTQQVGFSLRHARSLLYKHYIRE